MQFYFQLQVTRLIRLLKKLGLHPILGVILGVLLFVVFSLMLFSKTDYANWIYLAIAVSFLGKLSIADRCKALKRLFPSNDYLRLRFIENAAMVIPFQIWLLLEAEFFIAGMLIIWAVAFAFFSIPKYGGRAMPTPFKKWPFEFIVGFRKTFWLIGLAYFLVVKAIQVDNYYLSLFGLVLLFLTSMSFYQKPEHHYFVWIHKDTPKQFIWKKFSNAMICVSILAFLPLLSILISFSGMWATSLFVYLWGCILLCSKILAKYSSFPQEMGIPQVILYALSILFPPLLLLTIWIFYTKSISRLQTIL